MGDIVIALDGPGSAGKGTVARGVAKALGYQYVDTGAMYRALALAARAKAIRWTDEEALSNLANKLSFRFVWDGDILRILLDGRDITRAIRGEGIGIGASEVSRLAKVRTALLERQRAMAAPGGVVMDGRDIGTVVLPDADLKIYLDADLDERARRRHEELVRKGESVSLARVRDALHQRDEKDKNRSVAPLKQAEDAIYVDSTERSIRQTIELLLDLANTAIAAG